MPRSIGCCRWHPIGDRLEEGIRLATKAAQYASIAGDLFARAEEGSAAELLARAAAAKADDARRQAEDARSSEGAEPPPKRRRRNRKSAP